VPLIFGDVFFAIWRVEPIPNPFIGLGIEKDHIADIAGNLSALLCVIVGA
jgi:hypothetical protein